ncbi:MAG: hypothetical protein IJ555_01700 [Ruminococcus sp.]|nr:hypothetical protein [Ruminococcus sp.]
MNTSEKLGLNLPDQTDRFNVDDFNENFEKLDNAILPDEDGDLNTDGGGVYLEKEVFALAYSHKSGMSVDSDGKLAVGRQRFDRYVPGKVTQVSFYEEENEDTGQIEQITKVEANHRVILQAGQSVLEITEEGVTFNGKSLGGGSTPQNLRNTVTTATTVQRGS